MHFICSTFGSSGDVFPLLGLALELRSRGHEITFATNAHFAELAQRHGLHFEPLGSEEFFDACLRNPDLWHPQRAFRTVMQSLQPVMKRQYEIHAAHANSHNTVAISNCLGFGALVARDKFGLPLVTLQLQPAVLWSDHEPPELPGLFGPRWMKSILYRIAERFVIDPTVCPFLNAWRKELGLPPVRKVMHWWNSPDGIIGLFPDWYAPPQPDWPQPLVLTDFPLWNDRGTEQLAPEVERFLQQGDPPLVFTPGTANVHAAKFFAAATEACRLLGRRGILLTKYPEQIPQSLPSSVVHFPYVPLNLILPKSAAFIHHGGVGSASQGLAAGIPHLVMPLAHDQFDNAARLKRLEVGDWLKVGHFTSERVVNKLGALLDTASVRVACQRISAKLSSSNGLARTATAIEERWGAGARPGVSQ